MGYKYIFDPRVITADGIDKIKRRRIETGDGLIACRQELLYRQRNNAIDALQEGLTTGGDIADILHDTLEILRYTPLRE